MICPLKPPFANSTSLCTSQRNFLQSVVFASKTMQSGTYATYTTINVKGALLQTGIVSAQGQCAERSGIAIAGW